MSADRLELLSPAAQKVAGVMAGRRRRRSVLEMMRHNNG